MDQQLDRVGEAFGKYSINPNIENLKVLQDLTGQKELPEVLDATDALVQTAMEVKPLKKLQLAVYRLDNERLILLDKRVQLEANRHLNGKSVCSHLRSLTESIKQRIRVLTHEDDAQKKRQSRIFGMCCRLYQEKIKAQATKLLGPEAYEIAQDPDFVADAKRINKISDMSDPNDKLAFFEQHMYDLQDKYLPCGRILPTQLCQLLIITLTHADNPELLHDIADVSRCVPQQKEALPIGGLVRAAKTAVCVIQEEAFPDLAKQSRGSATN